MDEIFYCPYCGSENSIFVDPSGSSRQRLIVDCETCCRPIVVDARLAGGEVVSLDAKPEND